MYKLLIPLLIGLSASVLHAQVPTTAYAPAPIKPTPPSQSASPDAICGNAGTFQLGPTGVNTQSNDTALDTIFLCQFDSIFIDHNGDQDLSGDPNPATTPGIVYGFYNCPPTLIGDDVPTLVTDPCMLLGPGNLPILAYGPDPSGDIWFFNDGTLQTAYNLGQPVLFHFAPMTVDIFDLAANPDVVGFESAIVGAPPGPCVNVNVADEFAVVYLNAIQESGVDPTFGDDCRGKFQISGGYPEWDDNATYTIDISLSADPSIKALIQLPQAQLLDDAVVFFSAPQPGTYTVTVEDGKSCGHTFTVDMSACDASNSVLVSFPEENALPGETICVPVTVDNYNDVVGFSFSIMWDPTVLEYSSVQSPNPVLNPFNAGNLNELLVDQGLLGATFSDLSGNGSTLPPGSTLFEVCFLVVGQLSECTGLDLSNNPSGIQFESSSGGNYAVAVDTGLVCADVNPFEVLLEVVDTTCNGTASVQITLSGGGTPYEIIWQQIPGGAVNTEPPVLNSGDVVIIPGFNDGTYIFIMTDSNGIGTEFRDTITLALPQLGASLNLTQSPSCNGACDGVVTADVSVDGTVVSPVGYTFTWTGPTITDPTGPIQTGVCAGAYFVTVTAPDGCTATASGTLSQPSSVAQQNVQITAASCPGVNDGTITLNIQGGTPQANGDYDFEWWYSPDQNPPTLFTFQSGDPAMLTGLAAGNYYVTVTDANGCTFVPLAEYVVDNAREVTVDLVNLQNALCNGESSGSIEVALNANPAFINPNYQFFWAPAGFTQVNNNNTSVYSDLPAGNTYNVVGVDLNTGCQDTASFTITEPTPLVADTLNVTQPTCTFQNDGSITVIGTGGTGLGFNFTYAWSGGLPNGATQTNLGPGTYSVTVTDLNGCTDTLTVDLTLPIPPAIVSIDSTSVQCGSDGCLRVVTLPSAEIYTWTTLAGAPVGATDEVCNLQGDTYMIVVSDDKGCTSSDTIVLASVVPLLISDTTLTNPTCFGYGDGQIVVGASGGTPNYTYAWDNNTAGPINPTLLAGDHIVTVTDQQGCTFVDTFTLVNPPSISLSSTNIVPATCSDDCDGQATLIAGYATLPPTGGDFTFLWDDGGTDSIRIDLCPGFRHVTITDVNQCFRIDSVAIGSPPPVDANITATPATCSGDDDGTATAIGTAGNGGPFTYLWSTGATTSIVNGLAAGDYDVTVTDSEGCSAVFGTTVDEPDPIVVLQDVNNSSNNQCYGDSTGVVAATATGGNPGGYDFVWSDATGVSVGFDAIVNGLPAGNYSVTVTDPEGCTGVNTAISLLNPPPIQGSYEPWEPLICHGDVTLLYIDTIYGGSGGPFLFSLDYGSSLPVGLPLNLTGGDHIITYIEENTGCSYDEMITVAEPVQIEVTFTPPVIPIELGEDVELLPIITPIGLARDTFLWTNIQFLNRADTLEPIAHPIESTEFILTVYDTSGCTGSGSVIIEVDPNRNVYIPTAFKPSNVEGTSTHFSPWIGNGVQMVNFMRVYNRWGELMYENNNFVPQNQDSQGWDGRYRGDFVSPGVYVYIIEVLFEDNEVLLYRGDVTVVR